jgi:hypothetical protein
LVELSVADVRRFVDVRVEVGWKMDKTVEKFEGEFEGGRSRDGQGETIEFPFLVCIGKKT